MARALGGSQISQLPVMQNGLHNFSGLGNDPLTQYLAKMSRQQLNEIMSEMKVRSFLSMLSSTASLFCFLQNMLYNLDLN